MNDSPQLLGLVSETKQGRKGWKGALLYWNMVGSLTSQRPPRLEGGGTVPQDAQPRAVQTVRLREVVSIVDDLCERSATFLNVPAASGGADGKAERGYKTLKKDYDDLKTTVWGRVAEAQQVDDASVNYVRGEWAVLREMVT